MNRQRALELLSRSKPELQAIFGRRVHRAKSNSRKASRVNMATRLDGLSSDTGWKNGFW